MLNVEYDLSSYTNIEFEICYSIGQILFAKHLMTNEKFTSIDINKLQSGMYYFRIIADGNLINAGKLVIIKK
jgi:hypothetical protein